MSDISIKPIPFSPPSSLAQRLEFCLIVVCITHMLIIFGITWKPLSTPSPISNPTLEITLATTAHNKPVENAKFLAPTDQEASSPEHTDLLPQNTQPTEITSNEIQNITQLPQPQAQIETPTQKHDVVTTTENPNIKSVQSELPENIETANFMSEEQELLNQRISSLSADLALQQQLYAQQPRKRTISAATRATHDAQYLYEWRKRLERIGNQNYPAEAKRLGLHGDVLLLVAINADGTLHDVQIRKSSGHKVLDEAALRIVRLAAPFGPLPKEVRENTDILEIIRTWQFGNNHWQQG